jgi:hypothetical protein
MTVPSWLHDISSDEEEDVEETTQRMIVVVASRPAAAVVGVLTTLGAGTILYGTVKFIVNH